MMMKMMKMLRLLTSSAMEQPSSTFLIRNCTVDNGTHDTRQRTNDHISSTDWLYQNNLNKPFGMFESFLVYLGGPVACP